MRTERPLAVVDGGRPDGPTESDQVALNVARTHVQAAIGLLDAHQPRSGNVGGRWWDLEQALRDLHGALLLLDSAQEQ